MLLWQPSITARRNAVAAMLHTCPANGFTAAGSADEQYSKPRLGTRWRC